MKDKRGEYREMRGEKREEFKNKRFEMKMKYKKVFAEKLQSRLDKISDAKLEKVLVKIDTAKSKVESNTRMSEDKKERLFAQLDALKDLINEKLDKTPDDINVDELLK